MSTQTELPVDEPIIVMKRIYDAPRALVWEATTLPEHVKRWWGGPGFTNPVCEMDVRPGGEWNHVMRFPDGQELHMHFVFVEVEKPSRLVWKHRDQGITAGGPPPCVITTTLEDLGGRTRWTMVARFDSLADREAARAIGFARPIEASNERLTQYLPTMVRRPS
jgi:uncharacterized protein YndB with AHSA1/START domain